MAKGVRTPDNVYILSRIQEDKCYLSQTDESLLWHKQLGHTSFDNLVNINKIKAVRDIPKCASKIKLYVAHANMETKPELATKLRSSQHQNLWKSFMHICVGEIELQLFKVNYTRMMWIYFIKYKSKAFECFNNIRLLLRIKKILRLNVLERIEEENSPQKNLMNYVKSMESKEKSLLLGHLSKME